ncbi:acyltransferase [Thermolongibacillus altinsuensis]|nr:acyltransferase [Thermolongibacillus altinsuensis]
MARVYAMFAVLFVHVTSLGFAKTSPDSFVFPFYVLLNVLGKIGVPTFLLLSSLVLFYTYYEKPINRVTIQKFYKNRLLYILVPYLSFSVIYFFVKFFLDHAPVSFNDFIIQLSKSIAFGTAYTHLYFIVILLQFYLIFPFLLWLFQRYPFFRKHAIWIGILVQFLWVYTNMNYLQTPRKASILFSYASFCLTGAYLAIYYERIYNWIKDIKRSIHYIVVNFILFGFVWGIYSFLIYDIQTKRLIVSSLVHEVFWSGFGLISATFILTLSILSYEQISSKSKKHFLELGELSFGIFMIHPLILLVMRQLLSSGSPFVFHSWQIISAVVMYFASYYIVKWILLYVPHSWILFGKSSLKNMLIHH